MKKIQLTQNYETIVDNKYFEILSESNWRIGHKNNRKNLYARRTIYLNSKRIVQPMHRYLMKLEGYNISGKDIDHKDGNGLNNQISNLRLCNKTQNGGNRKISINNTSGYKGVSKKRNAKKWESSIKYNQKSIYLGLFSNKIDAAKAYDIAAVKYFGEFAKLNFS